MRKHLIPALLVLPGLLAAGQSNQSAGAQAAPWLLVSGNARQAALGDAVAALAGDVYSLGSAPAGLAQVKGQQLAASQNLWLQGSTLSHLAYAVGLAQDGALGVGINYQDFGQIDRYSVSNGALVSNGTATPSAYDLDLGWGQGLGMGLSLGVDLKSIHQDLDGSADNALGFDAAAQWDSGMGVRLGVAAQNMGGQLAGANLPMNTALGAAYSIGPGTLAVDLDAPSQGNVTVGVGAEGRLNDLLALRVGYHSNDTATNDLSVSGLTAGLGLKADWLRLDYAYRVQGDLGMANQFSARTNF